MSAMISIVVCAPMIIGVAVIIYALSVLYNFVTLHFVRPRKPTQAYKRLDANRSWALITGASSGIGLGIATELVKFGHGVLLLARSKENLEEAKRGIEHSYPGAFVRTVVMNAHAATAEDIHELVRSLDGLDITMLINNVGANPITNPPMRSLATYSPKDVDAVINMNARFMARLTALMLPLLSRRPKRTSEKSLILNVSSAGHIGLPWMTLYSATKGFVQSFSHGLARELEQDPTTRHIDCLCVIPGDVLSQSNCRGVTPGSPVASDYGKWIIWAIDGTVKQRMRNMIPYWRHDLQHRILYWTGEEKKTKALATFVAMKRDKWNDFLEKSK